SLRQSFAYQLLQRVAYADFDKRIKACIGHAAHDGFPTHRVIDLLLEDRLDFFAVRLGSKVGISRDTRGRESHGVNVGAERFYRVVHEGGMETAAYGERNHTAAGRFDQRFESLQTGFRTGNNQ